MSMHVWTRITRRPFVYARMLNQIHYAELKGDTERVERLNWLKTVIENIKERDVK